jgi:hypothetical protein
MTVAACATLSDAAAVNTSKEEGIKRIGDSNFEQNQSVARQPGSQPGSDLNSETIF